MNYGQRISLNSFRTNLKAFEIGVRESLYQPEKEEIFIALKKIKDPLIILTCKDDILISIDTDNKHYKTTKDDKSLGQYFYDIYFKNKEMRGNNMTQTTSSSTCDPQVWTTNLTSTSGTYISGDNYTYTIPSYTTTSAYVEVPSSKDVEKLKKDIKKL